MNFKQAVLGANNSHNLAIFMHLRFGSGLIIRKAVKPNKAIPAHIQNENPWLYKSGYEVTGYRIGDISIDDAKGEYVPEVQGGWIPWSLTERELERQNFMLI